MRYLSKKLAFTLVELLVVIAVIALLAALLLGPVSRAKATAILAACRSNLRQCCLSISMYVSDTEVFPAAHVSTDSWASVVLQYQNRSDLIPQLWGEDHKALSRTAFSCPGFSRMPGALDKQGSFPFGYNESGTIGLSSKYQDSLGLASPLRPMLVKAGQDRGVLESSITNPSEMVELADAQILAPAGESVFTPPFVIGSSLLILSPELSSYAFPYYRNRHPGMRMNVAFVDTHIETRKVPELYDFAQPPIRALWNRDFEPHGSLR